MPKRPIVSVVIPAYNGQLYIAEAIDSTLAQEGLPIEVIVVDDGSTDATEEIVRTYGKRVNYIKKTNGGVASARNLGVMCSEGEYVALLDQDDRFLPGKLLRQVELMKAHADAVACHGNIKMIDGNGMAVVDGPWRNNPAQLPSGNVFLKLFQGNFIMACTGLFNRNSAITVGMFDERIWGADDYNFWMKLARIGGIYHFNDYLSEYRWHATNASRDEYKMSEARLLARYYIVNEFNSLLEMVQKKEMIRILTKRTVDEAYSYYKGSRGKEARQLLGIGLRIAPWNFLIWKMYFVSFFCELKK